MGIILPVQLNSSLRSNKARAGELISARVMQDVPWPGGRKIQAGAKVMGHIVSARPAVNGMMSDLSLRFDTLAIGKRSVFDVNEPEGARDHDGCIRSTDSGRAAQIEELPRMNGRRIRSEERLSIAEELWHTARISLGFAAAVACWPG